MDRHISPNPAHIDDDVRGAARRAQLPGEPDAESPPLTEAASLRADPRPAPPPPAKQKSRNGLLVGVAITALAAAAGSVFVLSPYNHVVPVPPQVMATVHTLEARTGIGGERPLAPSASLAAVKLPPAPKAVIEPKFVAQSPVAELSELMKFHAGAWQSGAGAETTRMAAPQQGAGAASHAAAPSMPAASGPQAIGGPPAGYVPHEPGVAPERSSAPSQMAAAAPVDPPAHVPGPIGADQAVTAAREDHVASGKADHDLVRRTAATAPAGPSPVEQQAAATPVAHPAPTVPHDPVAVARELRPAPMTSTQQVQVLELVTQVATLVRDERSEVSELRADVARSEAASAAKIDDFARRLAIVEAHNAVVAASAAGGPPSVTPPAAPAPTSPPPAAAPVLLTRAEAAISAAQNQPSAQGLTPKRYRLQAASPGLALLAQVDRGGGDGAQLQVQVGDTIPGYGQVKSIAERGTAWVVTTENGAIQ